MTRGRAPCCPDRPSPTELRRWRVAARARTLNVVCFNLRFESEEELAAIAAGMAVDADRDDDTHDGSPGAPVGVPAR